METIVLELHKQNFKFSAAHFLIFDKLSAERLHGHNYQVKVNISIPSEVSLTENGYFFDFKVFKTIIKDLVDKWDEVVLLPRLHQDMNFKENGPSLEVRFRDRFYVFPKNEVLLLPITNTSVEQLSRLLAQALVEALKSYGVREVAVTVEETKGQGATTFVKA